MNIKRYFQEGEVNVKRKNRIQFWIPALVCVFVRNRCLLASGKGGRSHSIALLDENWEKKAPAWNREWLMILVLSYVKTGTTKV